MQEIYKNVSEIDSKFLRNLYEIYSKFIRNFIRSICEIFTKIIKKLPVICTLYSISATQAQDGISRIFPSETIFR